MPPSSKRAPLTFRRPILFLALALASAGVPSGLAVPLVGEIRMFGGNFAPAGWMFCEGQSLSISENETLFQLIGTTYGGDGQETFNLPDLRGRLPTGLGQAGTGPTRILGETWGIDIHPGLTLAHLPGAVASPGTLGLLAPRTPKGGAGLGQPFDVMPPALPVSFIISLYGIFPSPNSGGDEPFLSEIRMFAFDFAPKGYALCNGQLLPINQNQGLFSLLGTTFGGDGRVNFALPDMRGRIPIHVGGSHTLGERGGNTNASDRLTSEDLTFRGSGPGRQRVRTVGWQATDAAQTFNREPAGLGLNFSIALQGIFPSPN